MATEQKGKILTIPPAMEALQFAVNEVPQKRFKKELPIIDRRNPYLAKIILNSTELYSQVPARIPFNLSDYLNGVCAAHYVLRQSLGLNGNQVIQVTQEALTTYTDQMIQHLRSGGSQALIEWIQRSVEEIMPGVYEMLIGDDNSASLMLGLGDVAIPTQITLAQRNLTRLM